MNKWWLKIFGILLFTIFPQISHTMEEKKHSIIEDQATLSMLPLELKELIVIHSASNYVNENFDLNDLENLEQKYMRFSKRLSKICGKEYSLEISY